MNIMQLYLEKDLTNIARDVKFNVVDDVLVKVTSRVSVWSRNTARADRTSVSGDTGRGQHEHPTGNRREVSDGGGRGSSGPRGRRVRTVFGLAVDRAQT